MTVLQIEGPIGGGLRGELRVPGDKSISHRALLLAALADGTSVLHGLSDGDDVTRTASAVQALGAVVDGERVTGGRERLHEAQHVLDAGNSGTSMRLLAGICSSFPWLTVLQGDASLSRRPMDRVAEPLRLMGAAVDGRCEGRYPPLVVRGGRLTAIEYHLPVASAQVKSAVLLAGVGAEGVTTVHEPHPTRRHTEELLAACGVKVEVEGLSVSVTPGPLAPLDIDVPGDPSQAAFWAVAATIVPGSDLVIRPVYTGPSRAGFVDVLARMGADIHVDGGAIRVRHAPLVATEVGGAEVPAVIDEIPVLAVAAAVADGVTTFRDARELRVKESDRVATTTAALAALGAHVEELDDGLVVRGGNQLVGADVDARDDHRIAMASAVAALVAHGRTVVRGWDAVATSYPTFVRDLRSAARESTGDQIALAGHAGEHR